MFVIVTTNYYHHLSYQYIGTHRHLHSFPTRRSSDLESPASRDSRDRGPRPPACLPPGLAASNPRESTHATRCVRTGTLDRKSTRLTPVTVKSRMPSSA